MWQRFRRPHSSLGVSLMITTRTSVMVSVPDLGSGDFRFESGVLDMPTYHSGRVERFCKPSGNPRMFESYCRLPGFNPGAGIMYLLQHCTRETNGGIILFYWRKILCVHEIIFMIPAVDFSTRDAGTVVATT